MKRVTILCTDPVHPIQPWLAEWARSVADKAAVEIISDVAHAQGGDFLFLISCQQIVSRTLRTAYRFSLVLHASELPQGRGMSPHVWQILEGRTRLTLTLLNAEDKVDTGDIWHQITFEVPTTELVDEIHSRIFQAELDLMRWALANCEHQRPRPQHGEPSYYPRRTPADSEVDVTRPLSESFDLLRVADPQRYPAFFVHRGQKYRIRIDKL